MSLFLCFGKAWAVAVVGGCAWCEWESCEACRDGSTETTSLCSRQWACCGCWSVSLPGRHRLGAPAGQELVTVWQWPKGRAGWAACCGREDAASDSHLDTRFLLEPPVLGLLWSLSWEQSSCGRYTTRTFIPVCGVLRCRVVSLTMQALCWFLCAICLPLLRVGSRAAPQAPSSTSVSSDTGSEMQLALWFCTPPPGLDTRAGIKPEVSHGFAGLGVCVVGW